MTQGFEKFAVGVVWFSSWIAYLTCLGLGYAPMAVFPLLTIIPAVFALGQKLHWWEGRHDPETIARLGKFSWGMADIVRSFLITGRPRTGKTATAICGLLVSLFEKCPNWGGLIIDDKGLLHEVVTVMAEQFQQGHRMRVLRVRPKGAPEDWKPACRYNLISNSAIPASVYAKTIVDVGSSMVKGQSNPFFIQQAQIQIERAIEALRETADVGVSLRNVYIILNNDADLETVLEKLNERGTALALSLIKHFDESFSKQAPEQLSGVRSTIANFLHYFTNPEIATVFCEEENTVEFADIDKGKIICVSLPNKYLVERKYINTFLKLALYTHGMERFDYPAEVREKNNLIVLVADEAQHIVTAAEAGMSDYNTIDKLPEAKFCAIIATQSTTSLIPAFGSAEKAKVFLLNLGTHIYFSQSDDEAADRAAKHIGKHTIKKVSYSYGKQGTTRNVSDQDEFFVKAHVLRNLKRFECVIVHPEDGFQRTKLKPTTFTRPTERSSGSTNQDKPSTDKTL